MTFLHSFILIQLKTMASESPQTDEFSNQEESHQTDPSDNNFPDEDIDPNAPTQYIENDSTNDNQVSFEDKNISLTEFSMDFCKLYCTSHQF